MTELLRIHLGQDGDVVVVGDKSSAQDLKRVLEQALERVVEGSGSGPQPPGGFAATPVSGMAMLTWNPVHDASAYHVLRPPSEEVRDPQDRKDDTPQSFYVDSSVALGSTYYYAVVAEDSSQRVSVPSDVRAVTVRPDPPAPPPPGPPPGPSPDVPPAWLWSPTDVPPAWDCSWKPTIGAPAWGQLDIAELELKSLSLAQTANLRPYMLASLYEWAPRKSLLCNTLQEVKRHAHGEPYIGLTVRPTESDYRAITGTSMASQLSGFAGDLKHFGVGLAIRVGP